MKFRDKQPALYWCGVALVAIALIALPLVLTMVGTAWVRITNLAILFIFLALGLNIVVGFAGLLDLGYIAFYAVGAYVYALLASPHFGLHLPFWVILPIGAFFACVAGALLGSLFRTPDSGSATAAACGASALAAPMPPGDPPHATSSPTPSAVGRAHVHRRPAAVAGSHAAVAPRAARAPAGDRPDVAPPPR